MAQELHPGRSEQGMVTRVVRAYHGSTPAFDAPAWKLVMVPPGADESNTLPGLSMDLLRRAVEIYLGMPSPSSEPPPAVRKRLEWTPGLDAGELLARAPFERVGKAPP